MKIAQDVLDVLERAEVSDNRLKLVDQLPPSLYRNVNKVLEAIGGKWNRVLQAHLFDSPTAELLDAVLATGEYQRVKQDLGQFDTPPDLAERAADLANLRPGLSATEPSAGIGRLALAMRARGVEPMCVEIDAKRAEKLVTLGFRAVICGDFLALQQLPKRDRILMNPPFAAQADVDHVSKALDLVKPGGRLVSIMSSGAMHRSNRKAVAFRERVAALGGTFELLPGNAFASSGTGVTACILVVDL